MQSDDQQQFVEALLATSGDVVCYCGSADQIKEPANGVVSLLKMRASHPALHLDSTRRQIPTQDDSKFYSILRTGADRSERILAVFNFESTQQTVSVDLGAIDAHELRDLTTAERADSSTGWLSVSLPGYGYHLYSVH